MHGSPVIVLSRSELSSQLVSYLSAEAELCPDEDWHDNVIISRKLAACVLMTRVLCMLVYWLVQASLLLMA